MSTLPFDLHDYGLKVDLYTENENLIKFYRVKNKDRVNIIDDIQSYK